MCRFFLKKKKKENFQAHIGHGPLHWLDPKFSTLKQGRITSLIQQKRIRVIYTTTCSPQVVMYGDRLNPKSKLTGYNISYL